MRDPETRRGSLVIVGTGITLGVHVTSEALAAIQQADHLFYLVTESATATWLERLNPNATTLDDTYAIGKSRRLSYLEMTRRIVAAVESGERVCAAFYGHPGMFVSASHAALRRLRRAGYPVRMLPGISAEDCLFADLAVNPGTNGCQSFEATDFLMSRRRFDPTSELILWQVGVIGEGSIRTGMAARPERLQVLIKTLLKHYPRRHRVTLYEAANFPGCNPRIEHLPLERLPGARILPMTTLYVPALPQRAIDTKIYQWFREQ